MACITRPHPRRPRKIPTSESTGATEIARSPGRGQCHSTTPPTPIQAAEPLLSAAIDVVEKQGWQLDSITSYSGPNPDYPFRPWGPVVQFWAALVFRAAYQGGA